MFEKSDQQFANAAKHNSVRRHLLVSLQERRKHCSQAIVFLSLASLLQLLGILSVSRFVTSSSWNVLGLVGLTLVSSVAATIAEISRFYALDTQIKFIRMFEVTHGEAQAQPLLQSFNP